MLPGACETVPTNEQFLKNMTSFWVQHFLVGWLFYRVRVLVETFGELYTTSALLLYCMQSNSFVLYFFESKILLSALLKENNLSAFSFR